MEKRNFEYDIRQIDALMEDDDIWTWNESYHIFTLKTSAGDHKAAFLRELRKHGVTCKRGRCVVVYDGDTYELQDRKTHEPLFAAIPRF